LRYWSNTYLLFSKVLFNNISNKSFSRTITSTNLNSLWNTPITNIFDSAEACWLDNYFTTADYELIFVFVLNYKLIGLPLSLLNKDIYNIFVYKTDELLIYYYPVVWICSFIYRIDWIWMFINRILGSWKNQRPSFWWKVYEIKFFLNS
jgi:hypothetical protein